jgi:Ribosomal protein L19E
MNLKAKRELAARVLGVGKDRIKFDPNYLEDVEDAITRADIRSLVTARTILVKGIKGTSRGRARIKHAKAKREAKGRVLRKVRDQQGRVRRSSGLERLEHLDVI